MTQRLAPTTVEQREPYYKDVRELLVPGFLSRKVKVNGVTMGFRSLSPRDYVLLKYRGDEETTERVAWVIAQSIWMLDGEVVLGDESNRVVIKEMLEKLPASAMGELVRLIVTFQSRVNLSIERAPAFFYEQDSRQMWRIYGVDIAQRSGVPGADLIGLNPLQQMWCSFNVVEDEWESWKSEWTHTKLIAGTQSPKGVKKLNDRDEAAWKEEQDRRDSIQDAMFYQAQGMAKEDAKKVIKSDSRFSGQYEEIRAAQSPEELEEEMRKIKLGIKDEHDLIIEAYKNKIVERVESQKAASRQRVADAQKAAEEAGFDDVSLRPLLMSQDDLKAKLQEARGKKGQTVYFSSKANSLYERYINKKIATGKMHLDKEGRPVSVPDMDLNKKVKRNG